MQKLFVTSLAIAAAGYFGYQVFADKIKSAATSFVKENFSVRLSGFKVHKLNLKGIELRITLDLINLSSVSATAENVKADVYYLKNGLTPSSLASTSISTPFTVSAKDTTRISDIKITAPYTNIIYNTAMFTDSNPRFRVVVTADVNGESINLTQEFSRYE